MINCNTAEECSGRDVAWAEASASMLLFNSDQVKVTASMISNFINIELYIQGDFLTGPPLKMSLNWPPPQIYLDWAPLNFLGVGIIFTSPNTKSFFDHGGGSSLGL